MSSRQPIVLVGTKAQFIKTAPILRALDDLSIGYDLIYTGQHSETFDALERAFGTKAADLVLVPKTEASTKRGLLRWAFLFCAGAGKRIGSWRGAPWGLVHGDTASTLLSAVALRLAGVRVVHVEAGLRSPKLFNPFPEEIVRRLVSRIAALHLAPDPVSASNLKQTSGRVIQTCGNTMRDALLLALSRMESPPRSGGSGGYAVVSLHRSENLSSRAVFDALMLEVLRVASQTKTYFVLHPATRERINSTGWLPRLEEVAGLELLDRMDYAEFVRLLLGSSFLMTDGGSNQEEAAMLGLPTLLMRQETERSDGLGDNVVMSRLNVKIIRSFVERYVGKEWSIRKVEEFSPSREIALILAEF